MAEHRVPEFTLEQRTHVAVQMLVPLPEWARVIVDVQVLARQ